jgi:gluconolactonase
MNKSVFLSLLFISALISFGYAQNSKSVVAPGAKPEKLAGGFSFTEGPAVDKQGNVFFTDQPNNKILKWSTDGKLSVFCDNCGRANGMYFDKKGWLTTCSDEENELWSIGPDGNHQVLVSGFNGKKLNGPNDVWVHPSGALYFTDPLYPRPYWKRTPEMQQEGQFVYYLSADGKTLTRVITDLKQPNGVIGTEDGKTLYIADIGAGKTWRYTVEKDGTLSGKTLFTDMGSDGMTLDSKGNIYLTGKGVTVFNSKGEKIGHIPVEENWTANVCFGGKDMKTLFITASKSFYGLKMKVRGIR